MVMNRHYKILSEINQIYISKDINSLVYADYNIEYTIPDIAKDIEWKNILNPPLLNSSSSTFRELNYVVKQTHTRSTDDIKLIYDIDDSPNYLIYNLVDKLGIQFPFNYFKEFYNIVKPFIFNTKFYFNRIRPYNLAQIYNLDIDVIQTKTHHTPSYPSGHVVYTNLGASILADIYPQHKYLLSQIVGETTKSRIMQGVHYQSDCDAGILLSDHLFKILHPRLKRQYNGSY